MLFPVCCQWLFPNSYFSPGDPPAPLGPLLYINPLPSLIPNSYFSPVDPPLTYPDILTHIQSSSPTCPNLCCCFASRHIMDLWQLSMALWLHICSSNTPTDYIQPITLKVTHKSVAHAVHQVIPHAFHPFNHSFIHSSFHSFPPSFLPSFTPQLTSMPACRFDHVQDYVSLKHSSSSGSGSGSSSSGSGSGSGGSMATTNATVQPQPQQQRPSTKTTSSVAVGTERVKSVLLRRPVASAWLEDITHALDTETLLPLQWVLHLPLSQKYLMVAAFLASHNPKESDASIFAGNGRGKKRKVPCHDFLVGTYPSYSISPSNTSTNTPANTPLPHTR